MLVVGAVLIAIIVVGNVFLFHALSGCKAASEEDIPGLYTETTLWRFGVDIIEIYPDHTFKEGFIRYSTGETTTRHGTWAASWVGRELRVTLRNAAVVFRDWPTVSDNIGESPYILQQCGNGTRLQSVQREAFPVDFVKGDE